MFALCLRVDDYATDTTLIANDLSHKVATCVTLLFQQNVLSDVCSVVRINTLFKSLGCKITKLITSDLKRLGLPDSAGETKRAVLNTPLEFPKPRVKRRA